MRSRKELRVIAIAALITLPALGLHYLLYKDYIIYEQRLPDSGYTLAVTCKRPLSDPVTFYMHAVVTSDSGREIGRAALPLKGLDWPDEGKYYSITNLSLKDNNTKVYIESSRFPPLEVPIRITTPD